MSIQYINEFAPYWLCNECDNISNDPYICTTCDKTFRCTQCLSITNKKLYNNDKYMECEVCGYKIKTVIGECPQRWEFIKENEIENLYVNFKNYSDTEDTRRDFTLKFNFTNINIKTNINDFLCNFPKVEYLDDTKHILTNEELCYIYLLMILYERCRPSMCNCITCVTYKLIMKTNLNIFISNNQEHENITKFNLIIKYFDIFFNIDILRLFNINDLNDLNDLNNILQSSMFQENPKYSVKEKILNDIKEKSIKFKDCNNPDKDTTCCICMDDYEDDTQIIELECCKKIIHKDCILKWFSEYNHDCPLCKHIYEHNDNPIPNNNQNNDDDGSSNNDDGNNEANDDDSNNESNDDDGNNESNDDDGNNESNDDDGNNESYNDDGNNESNDDDGNNESNDDDGNNKSNDDDGNNESNDDDGNNESNDDADEESNIEKIEENSETDYEDLD